MIRGFLQEDADQALFDRIFSGASLTQVAEALSRGAILTDNDDDENNEEND